MTDSKHSVTHIHEAHINPIGYVECPARYRYEAPRQAVYGNDNEAVIRLADDPDLRLGLTGLDGFDRVWIIYLLHLNESWHPLVSPPHQDMHKVGVFATRSPHRPSRIAMSCVELVKVLDDGLRIRNHDLLDHTPILDIKPYIPYADSFPKAATGWLDDVAEPAYKVIVEAGAQKKADWIQSRAELDVINFCRVQLQFYPTDSDRKRTKANPDKANSYCIAFRTWRIDYLVNQEKRRVTIEDIHSGYSDADLADADLADPADRYQDKAVHRRFQSNWPTSA